MRHLEKKNQIAQPGNTRENYTPQECMLPKQNILFFIPMKVQLITISGAIPYISGMNSTSSSLETEKISRNRKREGKRGRETANEKKEEKEKKRECEREGKGEGKGEERSEREGREEKMGENGESGTKCSSLSTPPSPDARLHHRTRLGNNITPIKGELGKNTTPTSRGRSEPNAFPGSPSEPPAKTTKP